jgi:HEPN domain-containing protein
MDEAKRELVRSWLLKASHDLAAARLLASGQASLGDVVAYNCQQAAEKALKGYLVYWDVRVEKTHDVGLLLEAAVKIEPMIGTWSDAADRLTPYATVYRYPGLDEQPVPEELEEALDDADGILRQVVALLPPEVHPDSAGGDG